MSKKYDKFELKNENEIWINGRPLLEIIKEVELPFAHRELEERVSKGESQDELSLLAGDYIYPHSSSLYLPSRNLLDEPLSLADRGFVLEKDDPESGKSLLLECTCGIPECWFLQARIELTKTYVRWYDFSQFHRDWDYSLEYVFERKDYESQLSRKC
ncbi:hypothetical protein O5O45_19470 [Hahella aquimaris]|uniref:hypothetical protein n=1 Tax=Hahella sp. HNIBRBA332 TaxID=3015983 RepID=UPI00273C50AD|nr:hypothetical protein [Hahella sp. HNIBRBA332]WLQ11911.1 hypothetical protein O5O45_19470 [Hahella sp. HNIBRBA332]